MTAYEPSDRIEVKLNKLGVTFIMSPLTHAQKGEVMSCVAMKSGNFIQDRWEMVKLALKYSLKGVKGIETKNGPWNPTMEPDGTLAMSNLDVLFNISGASQILMAAALQFSGAGVPETITNQETEKPFEDVEVVLDPKA